MNDRLLSEFLRLRDFEEYMEQYSRFCGLRMGPAAFLKEMELMERDGTYTHREKESIRERKKRSELKRLQKQIDSLTEELNREGVWCLPVDPGETVEIRYLFPNGKQGDIQRYLAGLTHDPAAVGDNTYAVTFSGKEYPLIELMTMPGHNLFSTEDSEWESPGMAFLLRYHRIAQIERLMGQVNYYRMEYRSLRTIPNLPLKKTLQDYYRNLNAKRDELYEYLIGNGATNPRWRSEQTAYAIVREYYPDAKFQYQADFLFGQRLDIYIPSKKAAIEYQGKQHFEPVEFFGGDAGYKSNVMRDMRKKARCAAEGIAVLYWDYDQPLTVEYFVKNILPQIEK